MGMAASQARFLGLTARKTNVEYEGQQINQQRTALSNQSANYYNDLLGMTVPTPPSVDSYTKTTYSFEDGALTNEITALIAQTDGTYTLSYLSKWQDDYAPVAASSSIVNIKNGYYVGATELRELGSEDNSITDENERQKKVEEEQAWKNLLSEKYGETDWLVRYVTNTTTGQEVPYFYKKSEIDSNRNNVDENGNILNNISCYTIGSDQKVEEFKAIKGCKVERDTQEDYLNKHSERKRRLRNVCAYNSHNNRPGCI